MRKYKLEGKIAVLCHDLLDWAAWYETAERRVALDDIEGVTVSTVFLGLDHSFFGSDDPILFETLVFLPNDDTGEMRRYFTWEEAEEGHKEIVSQIKQQLDMAGEVTKNSLQMILAKTYG